MPNPDSKLNIKFNIQLDLETDEQLIALKDFLKMPKSQVIRHLITSAFRMNIQQIPTCANCESCRAPHTFAYSPHLPGPPRNDGHHQETPMQRGARLEPDPAGVDPRVAQRG